jgi:hypothetical protein
MRYRQAKPVDQANEGDHANAEWDRPFIAARYIEQLGRPQFFAHYVTRPLVPDTWAKYCPAQA